MQRKSGIYLCLGIVLALAIAIPLIAVEGIKNSRATGDDRGQSLGRKRWNDTFDIYTDWEVSWPETGVTRMLVFNVTEIEGYVGADGMSKEKAMLINGQYPGSSYASSIILDTFQAHKKKKLVPGPVIIADWGDHINVTVINNLRTNGTSLHWHGFRLLHNNLHDGTSGVTECPIPPGHSRTYRFQATQYGTSWYHSHLSSQYSDGLVGGIQINGPASDEYEIDLGVFPISDWYYSTADTLLARVLDPSNPFSPELPGSPPPSDNIFFNGTNVNPYRGGGAGGNYAKVVFTPGKRHRLRLINTSTDNTFTISIVSHTMTIIAVDFVPVQPQPTNSVYLTVGQRVDVIVEANQPIETYWLNATLSKTGVCGSSKNPFPAAVVQYEGAPWWAPGNQGDGPEDSNCLDDIMPIPIVPMHPPSIVFNASAANTLNVSLTVKSTVSEVLWTINSSSLDVRWATPTLRYVLDGVDTANIPGNSNVIEIPPRNEWSFWLIQNVSPIPHPMHVHGHDIIILARSSPFPSSSAQSPPSSTPTYSFPAAGTPTLIPFTDPPNTNDTTTNSTDTNSNSNSDTTIPPQRISPLRRDTTVLPGQGWLLVAFRANTNPGAWLFHCHIAWHVSQGLGVVFLEGRDEIIGGKESGNGSKDGKESQGRTAGEGGTGDGRIGVGIGDVSELEEGCAAWRGFISG